MARKTFVVSYFKCESSMRSTQSFRLRVGQCRIVWSHGLRFRATDNGVVVESLRRRVYPWHASVQVEADGWTNMMAGPTKVFRIGCHATQAASDQRAKWFLQQDHVNVASSDDPGNFDLSW